jgi:uncharacterized protein YcbK (DUF882 family)
VWRAVRRSIGGVAPPGRPPDIAAGTDAGAALEALPAPVSVFCAGRQSVATARAALRRSGRGWVRIAAVRSYPRQSSAEPGTSRRRFVAGIGLAIAAPMLCLSRRSRAATGPRALRFEHTHTGERLALTYAWGETYLPEALQSVNVFLRDFRNGEVHAIEPGLLDQLHLLAEVSTTREPFQVISGYRSPATNHMLREGGHGVATHSLHLEGRAIDIRVADVALADLHAAALSLRAGGVGYYASSDFIHIDTGRVRRW